MSHLGARPSSHPCQAQLLNSRHLHRCGWILQHHKETASHQHVVPLAQSLCCFFVLHVQHQLTSNNTRRPCIPLSDCPHPVSSPLPPPQPAAVPPLAACQQLPLLPFAASSPNPSPSTLTDSLRPRAPPCQQTPFLSPFNSPRGCAAWPTPFLLHSPSGALRRCDALCWGYGGCSERTPSGKEKQTTNHEG